MLWLLLIFFYLKIILFVGFFEGRKNGICVDLLFMLGILVFLGIGWVLVYLFCILIIFLDLVVVFVYGILFFGGFVKFFIFCLVVFLICILVKIIVIMIIVNKFLV